MPPSGDEDIVDNFFLRSILSQFWLQMKPSGDDVISVADLQDAKSSSFLLARDFFTLRVFFTWGDENSWKSTLLPWSSYKIFKDNWKKKLRNHFNCSLSPSSSTSRESSVKSSKTTSSSLAGEDLRLGPLNLGIEKGFEVSLALINHSWCCHHKAPQC